MGTLSKTYLLWDIPKQMERLTDDVSIFSALSLLQAFYQYSQVSFNTFVHRKQDIDCALEQNFPSEPSFFFSGYLSYLIFEHSEHLDWAIIQLEKNVTSNPLPRGIFS